MAKRSYEEIQAQILELQQEAQEARIDERNDAIKRILAEMARFDITADELRGLVPAGRVGTLAKNDGVAKGAQKEASAATSASDESPAVRMLLDAGIDFRRKSPTPIAPPAQGKAAPKYFDPKTGATWSGVARPPAWIKDAKDRSVFLIEKGETLVTHSKPAKKAATRAARRAPEKIAPRKVAAKGGSKAKGTASR
ncbi:H-NS family nucleoid-associated regulatory protein [Paraburkholderia sp. 35.1]|uniref:H-NS family nucleoid-associated regulatory protein n=1 Tax=Paraburkholderia sp. 35.1 TaxID=2991058 RepID=UPI003D21C311